MSIELFLMVEKSGETKKGDESKRGDTMRVFAITVPPPRYTGFSDGEQAGLGAPDSPKSHRSAVTPRTFMSRVSDFIGAFDSDDDFYFSHGSTSSDDDSATLERFKARAETAHPRTPTPSNSPAREGHRPKSAPSTGRSVCQANSESAGRPKRRAMTAATVAVSTAPSWFDPPDDYELMFHME